jgi:hypothetical protein
MTVRGKFQNPDHRLYLEDLEVGRRFTSATHAIDEAQIKPFAAQFARNRSISMTPRQKQRCSAAWRRADGIPRRSPCASWSIPDCR